MITSPVDPDNDPKRELEAAAFLICVVAVSGLTLFGLSVVYLTRWWFGL